MKGARFQAVSLNRKLAPQGSTPGESRSRPVAMGPFISATSVSLETCPGSCVWKSTPGSPGACYASSGFTKFQAAKLDAEAQELEPLEVIREEVRLINAAFRGGAVPQDGVAGSGRGLRLHQAGEVSCLRGAEELARAATSWLDRGGSTPFTFTHRWSEVRRASWGPISVLASVEDPRDMSAVARQGYSPAIVVETLPAGDQAFKVRGWSVVPCPFLTRGITCAECRLCWRGDQLLASKTAIGFSVHGPGAGHATGQ